ncbi:hypothetical protein [Miltoncostaea marina]|uniref:hypothetical protein n=1 Tax=Miltoncostaea marina TaxID=2843215 RepID=UPI001C3DDBDA|nr:hypothetical protein [Miltoncostaea marina]
MPRTVPPITRAAALSVAVAALGPAAGAASAADPPLLYVREPAAVAIHDAVGGPTLRQAPAAEGARWPHGRRVGKVAGREIAGREPKRIAAALRAGWRSDGAAGLVAVDEITPRHWTPRAARSLAAAMARLGPDARRVMFYASPALVEQVGRADPRRALPGRLRALVGALSRGRAVYLQTYRGDLTPFPAREMAMHPTRWAGRWPARGGELRVVVGPDRGAGQAEVWARLRATPAGRAMLANGPAAYGLVDAAAGRAWAAQHRAFLAAPDVSPTGRDAAVPVGGGLRLTRNGVRAVRVHITRPGRAVVTMTPRGGGARRAIRKLAGPTRRPVNVPLPRDARPGRYVVRAVLTGDGLRDRAAVGVRVTRRR